MGGLLHPKISKELPAIIRALIKWQVDLLSVLFLVYTDHKTLENFGVQKDLSCCQAHWMELMSQYDAKIVYVKGEDNTVVDVLTLVSRTLQLCLLSHGRGSLGDASICSLSLG